MEKERVGRRAAYFVEDGMLVGLGTGSTAYYFVDELAKRVKEEGLSVTAVATSNQTAEQAQSLGITIHALDDVGILDLTVDGADEVDPHFNGIKGGGGALLVEKIVASNSKKVIWIADSSKAVEKLGRFPLPVEVIPFGVQKVFDQFVAKGYQPAYRMRESEKFVTDMHHYIIDLHLEQIEDPYALAEELDTMVGVVEHGLFLNHPDLVLLGRGEEVIELENKR